MNSNSNAAYQKPSVESRSTEFVPVEGGAETTDAATYMVAAYVLMWVCTLVFVFITWRKSRNLYSKVQELESAIAKASKS